jgi:hypothetical protein
MPLAKINGQEIYSHISQKIFLSDVNAWLSARQKNSAISLDMPSFFCYASSSSTYI